MSRTETVRLRLTPDEKTRLKDMAQGDLSAFIRSRIFGPQMAAPTRTEPRSETGLSPASPSPEKAEVSDRPSPSPQDLVAKRRQLVNKFKYSKGLTTPQAEIEADRLLRVL